MTDRAAEEFAHEPVMSAEVVALLAPAPAGVFLDATLGGGGHSAAVLDANAGLSLVGLDRDPMAIAAAVTRLARFGDRVEVQHRRFDDLEHAIGEGRGSLTAVLFDLGVSSPQLDRAERGFSYRNDGPLDMRMDPGSGDPTAGELVNESDPSELLAILRTHADERFARRIVDAIVAARPIAGTAELARIVRDAIPAATRRTGGHPATRTFQALRIAVNRELEVLEPALRSAIDALAPGGRIVALTYHSGEDRIVKRVLREYERGGDLPPRGLPPPPGQTPQLKLLGRGGVVPTAQELDANPRAASARLRAAEKLGPSP